MNTICEYSTEREFMEDLRAMKAEKVFIFLDFQEQDYDLVDEAGTKTGIGKLITPLLILSSVVDSTNLIYRKICKSTDASEIEDGPKGYEKYITEIYKTEISGPEGISGKIRDSAPMAAIRDGKAYLK
jgi:hypothetical protein